jgi:hypothetical protein
MALPDYLPAAAGVLVEARHAFRDGLAETAAKEADDAVELALKTLIPLPPELRPGVGCCIKWPWHRVPQQPGCATLRFSTPS